LEKFDKVSLSFDLKIEITFNIFNLVKNGSEFYAVFEDINEEKG